MKAYFLFTASGPLVILTSYDSIEHPELVKRIRAKGITKFIAHEVPVELAKASYVYQLDITKEHYADPNLSISGDLAQAVAAARNKLRRCGNDDRD